MLGAAAATWHNSIIAIGRCDHALPRRNPARAPMARRASALPDIDVVQLYDAFTINTILFLEDLGFCAKGEGGPFVANGGIAPGGRLPVNTNGGGLGYGILACTACSP